MTCSAVFFVSFLKYPKIDGNDKKLSRLFLEFSFVLATQTNSESGEDVLQIIEPDLFVEKYAVKTDKKKKKDCKLVCVEKYPTCIKCPPFLTFVLYPTKQVNYKVRSTAKNYALFVRCKSTCKVPFIWTKQTNPYNKGYIYVGQDQAIRTNKETALLRVNRSN